MTEKFHPQKHIKRSVACTLGLYFFSLITVFTYDLIPDGKLDSECYRLAVANLVHPKELNLFLNIAIEIFTLSAVALAIGYVSNRCNTHEAEARQTLLPK